EEVHLVAYALLLLQALHEGGRLDPFELGLLGSTEADESQRQEEGRDSRREGEGDGEPAQVQGGKRRRLEQVRRKPGGEDGGQASLEAEKDENGAGSQARSRVQPGGFTGGEGKREPGAHRCGPRHPTRRKETQGECYRQGDAGGEEDAVIQRTLRAKDGEPNAAVLRPGTREMRGERQHREPQAGEERPCGHAVEQSPAAAGAEAAGAESVQAEGEGWLQRAQKRLGGGPEEKDPQRQKNGADDLQGSQPAWIGEEGGNGRHDENDGRQKKSVHEIDPAPPKQQEKQHDYSHDPAHQGQSPDQDGCDQRALADVVGAGITGLAHHPEGAAWQWSRDDVLWRIAADNRVGDSRDLVGILADGHRSGAGFALVGRTEALAGPQEELRESGLLGRGGCGLLFQRIFDELRLVSQANDHGISGGEESNQQLSLWSSGLRGHAFLLHLDEQAGTHGGGAVGT